MMVPREGRVEWRPLGQARVRREVGGSWGVEKKRMQGAETLGDGKKRKREEENWGSCKKRPDGSIEELTAAVAIDYLNGRPRRWNRSSRCLKLI